MTSETGSRTTTHNDASPKLSFVIACYNSRQYLWECLASILRATLPPYEVIVVDDGSTEDIREVVDRFAPLARYIRQENQGPAAARNRGILCATGEYIAFLDSDDYLLSSEAVEAAVAMLDTRPEVGLVHGQALKIDWQGRHFGIRRPAFARESYVRAGFDELADLLYGNYITTSSTIVRRSVLDQVGLFDPDIFSGEDWDLWLRIARSSSIAHVALPVVAYRVHDGSITARNRVEPLLRVHLQIVDRAFEDPEIARRFGPARRAIDAHMYSRAARRAYRSGQMRLAREYARKSLRTGGGDGLRRAGDNLSLIVRSCIPSPAHAMLRRASRRCKAALLSLRPARRSASPS